MENTGRIWKICRPEEGKRLQSNLVLTSYSLRNALIRFLMKIIMFFRCTLNDPKPEVVQGPGNKIASYNGNNVRFIIA